MASPRRIAEQTGDGASVDNRAPAIGPDQNPEAEQGGADAGRWPTEGELPIRPVEGVPATTGGFRPSPATHPLPTPGSTEGEQESP